MESSHTPSTGITRLHGITDPTVSNVHSLVAREEALSTLDDLVRSSARRMLQVALEREANDYVKAHAHLRMEISVYG